MTLSLVKSEYGGFRISFDEEGWFNATKAGEYFGRRVDNWLRLDETKGYIDALSRHLNPSHQRYLPCQ